MKIPKAGWNEKQKRWEAKGVSPSGVRRTYSGRTEREAVDRALKSYGLPGQDTTLYGYYASAYIPTIANRSENWINQIGWAMDLHVLPALGKVELQDITRTMLQRFFNGLSLNLSSSSIHRIKIVLSTVLNLAEMDEMIARNPCRAVRLPHGKPKPHHVLSTTELWELYEAATPQVKPVVLLCGFAGLRVGECVGTSWGAIGEDGVLAVRQQVLQLKGGARVTMTLKTQTSYRPIPLPPALIEAMRLANGKRCLWVCADTKGGFLTPNNAARGLAVAAKLSGVGKVTPHDLRHTFVSLMGLEFDAPTEVVMELVGHAKQSITSIYSKASMETKRRWMETYWERVSTNLGTKLRTQLEVSG